MNTYRIIIFNLFFFCLTTSIWAGITNPKIESPPSWVIPATINYQLTSLDNEAEDGYVDLLYEKQVSLAQQATFVKKTLRLLSETGVQNLSQVSVEFDPSYEQLSFHTVRIVRNGTVIDELQASRIKTIQQEKELDRSIYNGTYTAVLILDDLRKDDILEYSYTIKGFNPIFKNKYAENYPVKFDVPIYDMHYRLLCPAGRKLNIANNLTDVKPSVTTTGNETVYDWNIANQHPISVEKSLPSWYDPYATVMVSEFGSWKEVIDWAAELFPFSTPPAAGLQKKIDDIKKSSATPEARLLAALRFVQDDVRYTGIEMGESSHKPHAPARVFVQRFGDCKDKAYLLCTMLRAMNIEAYPVLINTTAKKSLAGLLPSPKAFDHTTACALLNGKKYWLDATSSYQRGPVANLSFPDYQAGLVIQPANTGLTTIPAQGNGKAVVKEAFYITDLNRPAQLVVTTRFSGSFADNTRYNFRSKSNKEIQKECKAYYTPYFSKLNIDSLTSSDDESTGVFTTTEYYTIRDLWKAKDGKQTTSFEPYSINSYIKKPDDEKRKMPFALYYPASYEEEIEIHLPEDWPISESSQQFGTDAFVFSYEYSRLRSDVVLLKYRYENLKDHVTASDVSTYLQQWEAAEKGMSFALTEGYSDDTSSSISTGTKELSRDGRFTVAYIILGLCACGTFVYRRTKRQQRF